MNDSEKYKNLVIENDYTADIYIVCGCGNEYAINSDFEIEFKSIKCKKCERYIPLFIDGEWTCVEK